uniref:Reverse transcriptase/retrotransposon-derived protein RNase H-like domain-containing protein n=1 Tax=Strigamia maritima TaxID=126957 RepID=T1IKC2_STRMM
MPISFTRSPSRKQSPPPRNSGPPPRRHPSPPRRQSSKARRSMSPQYSSSRDHSTSREEEWRTKMMEKQMECMDSMISRLEQGNQGSPGPAPPGRLKGAKIPTFDGSQEQCVSFLNAIKAAAEASGLTLDVIINRGLSSYLLGDAYDWFVEYKETFTSVRVFAQQFKERFDMSELNRQQAFERLKDLLCADKVLLMPDLAKPFVVLTDTSHQGLGAVLCQDVD